MNPGRCFAAWLPVVAIGVFCASLNTWVLDNPSRFDLTSSAVYSLGSESRRVLDALETPVDIVFFHDQRSRAMQDARYLLEHYARHSPLVTVSSHDPMLEPALAERHGVRFAGTALFSAGARRVVVNEATEVAFTNALIRASSAVQGRVCFTDGHVESNPFSLQTHDHYENEGSRAHDHSSGGRPMTLHERHGMGMARNALETLGYEVEQRRLLQGEAPLGGCTVVVVASPQQSFTAPEASLLEKALEAGTAVLVLLEPGVGHGLDALLARYGVRSTRSRVSDPAQYYRTDPSTPAVSNYARHRVTRDLGLSFFPGVAALEPLRDPRTRDDLVYTPLATTSDAAFTIGDARADTRSRTLVLHVAGRDSELRLAIVGDGDFATNSFFGALGNGQLFLNLVSDLAGPEGAVDITPREYRLARLELDNRAVRLTFLLTTVAAPTVLLVIGAWVAWRRR